MLEVGVVGWEWDFAVEGGLATGFEGVGSEFGGVDSEVEEDGSEVEDAAVEDSVLEDATYSPAIPVVVSTLARGYPAHVGGIQGPDAGAGEPDRH